MKALPLALLAFLAACVPAEPAELSPRGQARLDEALAGRTAGPSVACVSHADLGSSRAIDDGVILFEGRGDTIWVNRPGGGCPGLRFGHAMVTRTSGARLCRGDIVTLMDPVSRAEFGGCGLGDFEPWRRSR